MHCNVKACIGIHCSTRVLVLILKIVLALLLHSSIADTHHIEDTSTAVELQKETIMADGTDMSGTGMSVRHFAVTCWPVARVKMAL